MSPSGPLGGTESPIETPFRLCLSLRIGPLLVGVVADVSCVRASLLLPVALGVGAPAEARALLPSPAKERAERPADGRVGAQ